MINQNMQQIITNFKKNYQNYIQQSIYNLNLNKEQLCSGKKFIVNKETLQYYIKKYYYNNNNNNNKFRKLTIQEYNFFKDRLNKNKYYSETQYSIIEGYVNKHTQYILSVISNKEVKLIYKIYNIQNMNYPETPI